MGRGKSSKNLSPAAILLGNSPETRNLNPFPQKEPRTSLSGQPKMIDVKSSNIARIGYDRRRKEVHVTYKSHQKKNGDVTPERSGFYSNVAFDVYEAFLASESKGKFTRNIFGTNDAYTWQYLS